MLVKGIQSLYDEVDDMVDNSFVWARNLYAFFYSVHDNTFKLIISAPDVQASSSDLTTQKGIRWLVLLIAVTDGRIKYNSTTINIYGTKTMPIAMLVYCQ